MGRNEIRLRRNMMSAGRIARHRNYGELMARHERNQKIKRMARLFTYFLLIAFLLIIFIIVIRWEKKEEMKHNPQKETTSAITHHPPTHQTTHHSL